MAGYMANPHFRELELSQSDFIYKGVVSLVPNAVMVCSWSNKDKDGEDHKPRGKQQRQRPYLPVHYHMMCKAMTFCSFDSNKNLAASHRANTSLVTSRQL